MSWSSDVLASLIRLVVSMLACSSILSAYLWLSLFISSLTYGTSRSWCSVSLMRYHGTLTIIRRYLFWNLYNILYLNWRLQLNTIGPNRLENCLVYVGYFYQDGINKPSLTTQIERTTKKGTLYSSSPRYSASRKTSYLILLASFWSRTRTELLWQRFFSPFYSLMLALAIPWHKQERPWYLVPCFV